MMNQDSQRGVATATVETLVAEVRVLIVGSRQVTLSVARQLDNVDLSQMDPMGRISIFPDTPSDGGWVIGRDRRDGALVRAQFWTRYDIPLIDLKENRLSVRRGTPTAYGGVYRLSLRGRDIKVSGRCADESDDIPEGCGWYADGFALSEISAQLRDHDERVAIHAAASKLPLIVLAGLR